MKRVMIMGGPGSGKSTLSRALGRRTGLPVHHMDHIHWLSGWVERARADKVALAHAVERQESWIFEGGLSATYDHRAGRADTLIWLDLPVGLRLWRVLRRMLRHWGQQRPDLPEGCAEGLNPGTFAFFHFIWRTRQTNRDKVLRVIADHPHLLVFHLKTPQAVREFEESQGL